MSIFDKISNFFGIEPKEKPQKKEDSSVSTKIPDQIKDSFFKSMSSGISRRGILKEEEPISSGLNRMGFSEERATKFGPDFARITTRALSTIGHTTRRSIFPKEFDIELEQTPITDYLFGEEPIRAIGPGGGGSKTAQWFEDKGVPKELASITAYGGAFALTSLDTMNPFKSAGKKLVDDLLKGNTPELIWETLSKRKLMGKFTKEEIETLAKTQDRNIIEEMVITKGNQSMNAIDESVKMFDNGELDDQSLAAILKKELPDQEGVIEDFASNLKGLRENGISVKETVDNLLKESTSFVDEMDPFYNLNRMKISDEAKSLIKEDIKALKPEIEKITGQPLTFKEVIEHAQETGTKLNETIGRELTKEYGAAVLNTRRALAKAMETGKLTGDDIQTFLIEKSIATDAARILGQRRIIAEAEKAEDLPIIREMLDRIAKEGSIMDDVIKAAEKVDFNDAKQATEFFRKFVKPKVSEWIDLLRYSSMLSSPVTHIVNIAGGILGGGLVHPLTTLAKGSVDFVRSKIMGGPRKYYTGETVEYFKGATSRENIKKAYQTFTDVLKGKTSIRHMDIRRVPLATKGGIAHVEKTLSTPMRMMEAADRFIGTLIESGVKKQLTYQASKSGKILDPRKITQIGKDAYQKSEEILFRGDLIKSENGPVLNLMGTFANSVAQWRKSDNVIASTIAKFTFPFIRTGVNIINQGIEYSPLGWTTVIGSKNKTEQIAKAMIGTVFATAAGTLVASDRLTARAPTNPTEKAAFYAAGRQPWSIYINGRWFSYRQLHPAIAFPMALASSIDQEFFQKGNDEEGEKIWGVVAEYFGFITDMSMLRNVGDFVDGFRGDKEGFTKMASNYPQQLIPFRAMLSWVNRLTDPVQRKADPDASGLRQQMQWVMAQIPGLSQKVPARVDTKGEPITRPFSERAISAVSPVRVTEEPPEARKEYQEYQEVKGAKGEEIKESREITKKIDDFISKIPYAKPEDRIKMMQVLLEEHPTITPERLTDAIKSSSIKLTQSEKTLKSMSTKGKATLITNKIKKMNQQERVDYITNLVEKGIVTDAVSKEISLLLASPTQ